MKDYEEKSIMYGNGGNNTADTNGTVVRMTLNNNSKKVLSEVFNTFAPVNEGFVKTTIPLNNKLPHLVNIFRLSGVRCTITNIL